MEHFLPVIDWYICAYYFNDEYRDVIKLLHKSAS